MVTHCPGLSERGNLIYRFCHCDRPRGARQSPPYSYSHNPYIPIIPYVIPTKVGIYLFLSLQLIRGAW